MPNILGKLVSWALGGQNLPVSSPELLKEFQGYLQKVHDVSIGDLPTRKKRKEYGELLNGLSEDAYTVYFMQMLGMVQSPKDHCEQFKDSEEQVSNILSWLPRMKDKKELVLLVIQERRKKYKLTV